MPGRLLGRALAPLSPSLHPVDSHHDHTARRESTMEHLKRHSLHRLARTRSDKEKDKSPALQSSAAQSTRKSSPSPHSRPVKAANTLELLIESPPNTFYGNPQTSTGALFSGQLRLSVTGPEITLDTFVMQLVARVGARKPVVKECSECQTKQTILFKWTFIREPKHLKTGVHYFPFSYLLPGHLPATTAGQLGKLEYALCAQAHTRTNEEITLQHPLFLSRAIQPVPEKNSLRIFPPTNLTAHVSFEPIIHPIGEFAVLMRLDGITAAQPGNPGIIMRWRLRKMSWRLEEHEKMISPVCAKHAGKLGGEGKGLLHEETRSLGHDELKEGWKTDYGTPGSIEMEFKARPAGNPRPLCDVDSPTGLEVRHLLIIELIVAEEWAHSKRPTVATPTGAARVLRMQFNVMVTERAGMGISWDEEQPPMYEDVPASPPLYRADENIPSYSFASGVGDEASSIRDYEGPPLDDDMERLALND